MTTPLGMPPGRNHPGESSFEDLRESVRETPVERAPAVGQGRGLLTHGRDLERTVSRVIFFSRWLQLPLYIGLIAAQGVYVWQFWIELSHLLSAVMGDTHAVQTVTCAVQAAGTRLGSGAPIRFAPIAA